MLEVYRSMGWQLTDVSRYRVSRSALGAVTVCWIQFSTKWAKVGPSFLCSKQLNVRGGRFNFKV